LIRFIVLRAYHHCGYTPTTTTPHACCHLPPGLVTPPHTTVGYCSVEFIDYWFPRTYHCHRTATFHCHLLPTAATATAACAAAYLRYAARHHLHRGTLRRAALRCQCHTHFAHAATALPVFLHLLNSNAAAHARFLTRCGLVCGRLHTWPPRCYVLVFYSLPVLYVLVHACGATSFAVRFSSSLFPVHACTTPLPLVPA